MNGNDMLPIMSLYMNMHLAQGQSLKFVLKARFNRFLQIKLFVFQYCVGWRINVNIRIRLT